MHNFLQGLSTMDHAFTFYVKIVFLWLELWSMKANEATKRVILSMSMQNPTQVCDLPSLKCSLSSTDIKGYNSA